MKAIQKFFQSLQQAIAAIFAPLAKGAFGPSHDDYPATGTQPLREDGKKSKRGRRLWGR
ncbi:MAG: hypothetical protein AAFY57_15050 [Cyanobacteria bacterium J06642_2]